MSLIRFTVSTVVAWSIFFFGGIIWHKVIFATWYNEWVFSIERLEMPILYFIITHAMRALIFVYVYHMLYKGGVPLIKGLKFGFLMGILTGLTVTSYYGDFNITSPGWALLEFTFNIVRALVVGVSIALIIGERNREPIP
ncbi:hypothetical protein OAL15_02380 [Flavobacteriales bacterium]|jgi:hypothetical protein|nr:hypothetical protein [Flavobacteriales bacterium]